MQLLRIDWNVLFTIINLIVLYLLLKKFLIWTGNRYYAEA